MKLSIMRRFYFCIEACKVLIELSVQNANVDAQAVHLWFKLMRDTNYSVALGPYVSYHEAFSILRDYLLF